MASPTAPEGFAQWRIRFEALDHLLTHYEDRERAILVKMKCPIRPAEIYAILNREQPAPWPKRTAERDRTRALHAMHVLVQIAAVRQHLRPSAVDGPAAATAAFLAGLYANDAAIHAAIQQKARTGGKKGAESQLKIAAGRRDRVRQLLAQWGASADLQEDFPKVTRFIEERTGLPDRSIRRYLEQIRRERRQASA